MLKLGVNHLHVNLAYKIYLPSNNSGGTRNKGSFIGYFAGDIGMVTTEFSPFSEI